MFRSLLQNVSLIRLLLFTHLGSSVVAQSNLTCYNPDGTVNDYDTPCNPDAEVSHCCSSYALCLDNKLCFEQAYSQLNQGSCTERTWGTSECFSNNDNDGSMCPGPDAYVFTCQNTGGYYYYCDTDDSITCNNDTLTDSFYVGSGYLADFRNGSTSIVTYTVTSSAYDSTSTNSDFEVITSSSPSPECTRGPNDGDGITATFTQTVTLPLPAGASAAATGAASSFIPLAQCPSHTGEKVGIGAGVGIPLGAALIGALGYGFWERRKRKRIEEDLRGGEKDEGRGIAGGIGGVGENGIMGGGS